jgi:thiamine-phosphate pyrophosphorylase
LSARATQQQVPRGHAFHGLHVLCDDDPRWPRGPVEVARLACQGGASVVQLRVKHATDRDAVAWGRAIRVLTREHGVRFVVDDRFDLALVCEADAVHLGQADLPPDALPPEALERLAVGRSTHDVLQARAARAEPVDYVAFGPLFATTSKQAAGEARGLPALTEIVKAVAPLPVIAIGGIDASRIEAVARTGAAGAAVISAVAAAGDPAAATRELVHRFAAGAGAPGGTP